MRKKDRVSELFDACSCDTLTEEDVKEILSWPTEKKVLFALKIISRIMRY